MPLIPPFFPNNKFITDFKETLELLNSFFSEQWSLLKNECEFHVCSNYLTNEYLSNVSYSSTGIVKVNPHKAHGHNKISICILNYDFEILIL